ncbi:TRAP transporter small permease [Clostridium sp. AM58-1XD]|nr:TRAP transporter small permease [Clostridium sp. AM58-1XD]
MEVSMKDKLLIEEHIIAALLLIMLAIMGVNVITRMIPIGISLAFTEELVTYSFVCTSLLGASAACARGANMGLDALVSLMPPAAKKVFLFISCAASVLLFGFLFYQGVITLQSVVEYNQKTPILQIPQWIFTSFYCIGPALYIFRAIQFCIRKCREVGKS